MKRWYSPATLHPEELRALLIRAEADPDFLQSLQDFVNGLKDRFSPEHERESWRKLLEDMNPVSDDLQ